MSANKLHEATNTAARAIIAADKTKHDEKTERLKEARLAKEAAIVPAPPEKLRAKALKAKGAKP